MPEEEGPVAQWIARQNKDLDAELMRLCARFGIQQVKVRVAKLKLPRGRHQLLPRIEDLCVWEAVEARMTEIAATRKRLSNPAQVSVRNACAQLCEGEGFDVRKAAKALGYELDLPPNSRLAQPVKKPQILIDILRRAKEYRLTPRGVRIVPLPRSAKQ